MTEIAVAIVLGCVTIAVAIHNGLYEIRRSINGVREELNLTIADLRILKAIFKRVEREISREVQVQQDMRNDRERRRRARLDKQWKEAVASGEVRTLDG